MSKNLRYVEISKRNPVTRIFVGGGNSCNSYSLCSDVCIVIEREGSKKCSPKIEYDQCGNACHPVCDTFVAKVCAQEIDANGYAVFVWPKELMGIREGWYTGTVVSGCNTCGVFPVRVGPRCNVIKVETHIMGPDSACVVTCDDDPCVTPICPTGTTGTPNVYTPAYEIEFVETDDKPCIGLLSSNKAPSLMGKTEPCEI
jgi:hypothetical protein